MSDELFRSWNDPEPEEEASDASGGAQDADYWQKQAEEHSNRLRETQSKVSDQAEQIAATNQMLQNLIQMQTEQVNRPVHAASTTGNPTTDYLTRLANGGGTQQVPDMSKFVSTEEVDRRANEIANHAINQRLQQADIFQKTMGQVHAKFLVEEPDLVAYETVAARLFHAAPGNTEQKYHSAIGELKGMIATGALPPPRKQARPSGSPTGGQHMDAWTSQRSNRQQDDVTTIPTMADMRTEMEEWTKQKREIQQARKDIRPVQKVSKLDFSYR